jgi:hypothetical protein
MMYTTSSDEPYHCTIQSRFVLISDTLPPIPYRAGLYGRPV